MRKWILKKWNSIFGKKETPKIKPDNPIDAIKRTGNMDTKQFYNKFKIK